MSKKKGVSLDEKRQRMLQIFYEKKEFFTLKELETIAPKEKHIVAQSVKGVVQALVDDGLLCTDKIGTLTFYWTFPGENITAIEKRIAESNKKIVEAEFKLDKISEELKKEKAGKKDAEELQAILKEVQDLKNQEAQLKKQIAKFIDADPEVIPKMKEKAQAYKEAANTWTDNIFGIQTWCKKKFDISVEELNKQFNIPSDLDYVENKN